MKKIIAHRGVFNNKDIPENSLKSFREAVKLNYDVEFDIHLTKDNILVVFHDDNLKRMTGLDKNIQDCTYDEIKDLKLLNTNEHIPTLDEVLKVIDNKVFMDIEVKSTKRIKETCDLLIDKLKNYKDYSFKSFDPRIVRYINKNYPDMKVGYLIGDKYDVKILKYILPSRLLIKYSGCDFLSISKHLLKKKKFKKLSDKYPIQVWTIKDMKEILNDKYTYICNNIKE